MGLLSVGPCCSVLPDMGGTLDLRLGNSVEGGNSFSTHGTICTQVMASSQAPLLRPLQCHSAQPTRAPCPELGVARPVFQQVCGPGPGSAVAEIGLLLGSGRL